jgi:hypothetical protein
LSVAITAEVNQADAVEYCRVVQVKEKFGGLRYYLRGYRNDAINLMIEQAESLSYEICEQCGSMKGQLMSNGCYFVACPACAGKVSPKAKPVRRISDRNVGDE